MTPSGPKPASIILPITMKPTYRQIAESLNLWNEYVDPQGKSDDFFHSLSVDQRIQVIENTFGPEPENDESPYEEI